MFVEDVYTGSDAELCLRNVAYVPQIPLDKQQNVFPWIPKEKLIPCIFDLQWINTFVDLLKSSKNTPTLPFA